MLLSVKRGISGLILRVKLRDSTLTTGAGKTGLTSASTGLIISTIADNEAAATAYTVAGSTIEAVTTLGTYAAPTATKCRFKEVDATNHKGVYEVHLADARYAVSSAKYLIVSFSGVTGLAEEDVLIPLVDLDPYSGTIATVTNLTNAATNGDFTTTMKSSIAASAVASVTAGVSLADGAITAAKIADDALAAVKFATDALEAIAAQVRTELATELAKIDAPISSRSEFDPETDKVDLTDETLLKFQGSLG